MKTRTIILVVMAIICGVSTAAGVAHFNRLDKKKADVVRVVVARADIPRGHVVTPEQVVLRDWPRELVPEDAVYEIESVTDRAVAIPLLASEVVRDSKLASRESGRGLAALVPQGMRAYTIQTDRVAASVAGFVMPGNRVDVLLTLKGTQRDPRGGTGTTLLQAVEILAVDQYVDAPVSNKVDPAKSQSVTLLVTPDQASRLDLAQNLGQLTLSLRNPQDLDEADTQPTTLSEIRFHQDPLVNPPSFVSQMISEELALANMAPTAKPKPDDPPVDDAPKEPEEKQAPKRKQLRIYTLRGNSAGNVFLPSQSPR